MARSVKEPKGDEKKVKKLKKKEAKQEDESNAEKPLFSLLADDTRIDPTLSSLFATKSAPAIRRNAASLVDSEILSDSKDEENANLPIEDSPKDAINAEKLNEVEILEPEGKQRKRKRKQDDGEDVEDMYMRRLVREEAKEAETAATERAIKRQRPGVTDEDGEEEQEVGRATSHTDHKSDETELSDDFSPPPRHETEQAADLELEKAKRTVFLGNVSTSAISSKSSRKILIEHLKSIFTSAPSPKDGASKHALESIRFRSTPYASAMPKKAAFARKEVMDATTKSTNAYAVYSSSLLARAAVTQLNGSMVLERHLRVDSIAHPAAVDNRRCVFVGNLGFVDDESNIQAAKEEEGARKRKPKEAADVEEGLWRTFGKCGTVESVRVVRDSATRIGKGFAYVQFSDGNAVEAALALNDKKFPPMLPRKLRVTRAKAVNRNAKTGVRPGMDRANANGYRSKASVERASKAGRAGKLFGKAAAAEAKKFVRPMRPETGNTREMPNGVIKPEAFVFEGHRAQSKGGKAGLKLGKKKAGKPTNRSARRGAAFKVGGKKKAQK